MGPGRRGSERLVACRLRALPRTFRVAAPAAPEPALPAAIAPPPLPPVPPAPVALEPVAFEPVAPVLPEPVAPPAPVPAPVDSAEPPPPVVADPTPTEAAPDATPPLPLRNRLSVGSFADLRATPESVPPPAPVERAPDSPIAHQHATYEAVSEAVDAAVTNSPIDPLDPTTDFGEDL
ncbi:MAG TPA: hypothetical protein VFR41_01235, partial [Acidimicrobiia bacterium]|nr:hypothetical protein [Acidimicrobiia bacterium]